MPSTSHISRAEQTSRRSRSWRQRYPLHRPYAYSQNNRSRYSRQRETRRCSAMPRCRSPSLCPAASNTDMPTSPPPASKRRGMTTDAPLSSNLSKNVSSFVIYHLFVRFDFRDTRREKSQEELNLLFYPHLSRMKQGQEGVLTGTEYLICKQVIRDHDEFAGRRGCRINAQPAAEGGFTVWFTLPAR